MLRTTMGRATAFEKVRIARELCRRPIIAEAFADGRLSYSAVRAITRVRAPEPAADTALVKLAVARSVDDVERAVPCYQLHAEQHRPPADDDRRGERIARGFDGTTRIEITVSDVEGEELAAASGRLSTTRPAPASLQRETQKTPSDCPGRLQETQQTATTGPLTSQAILQRETPGGVRAGGPTRSWTWSVSPRLTCRTVPRPATIGTWFTWSPGLMGGVSWPTGHRSMRPPPSPATWFTVEASHDNRPAARPFPWVRAADR